MESSNHGYFRKQVQRDRAPRCVCTERCSQSAQRHISTQPPLPLALYAVKKMLASRWAYVGAACEQAKRVATSSHSVRRGSAVKRPTATTGSQRESRTANGFHTNFNHSFMKGTNHPLVDDIKNSVIRHRSGGSSWLMAYINKGSSGRLPGGRHAARHVTAANPRLFSFSVGAKNKKIAPGNLQTRFLFGRAATNTC